jgi:hypothetical protein
MLTYITVIICNTQLHWLHTRFIFLFSSYVNSWICACVLLYTDVSTELSLYILGSQNAHALNYESVTNQNCGTQVWLVTHSCFYSVYSIYWQLPFGGTIVSNLDFHLVSMVTKLYHSHDNHRPRKPGCHLIIQSITQSHQWHYKSYTQPPLEI